MGINEGAIILAILIIAVCLIWHLWETFCENNNENNISEHETAKDFFNHFKETK